MAKSNLDSPATKRDLNSLQTEIRTELVKFHLEMDDFKEAVRWDVKAYHNDIMGMKDEIVGEIRAMREEFIAHQGKHDRQQDALDNHEKRLTTLETS